MATGRYPWHHLPPQMHNPFCLVFHIGQLTPPPNHHPIIPDHLSPELQGVLKRCFSPTPADRPSATALLADPYFAAAQLPPSAETLDSFTDAMQFARQESTGDFGHAPSEIVVSQVVMGTMGSLA